MHHQLLQTYGSSWAHGSKFFYFFFYFLIFFVFFFFYFIAPRQISSTKKVFFIFIFFNASRIRNSTSLYDERKSSSSSPTRQRKKKRRKREKEGERDRESSPLLLQALSLSLYTSIRSLSIRFSLIDSNLEKETKETKENDFLRTFYHERAFKGVIIRLWALSELHHPSPLRILHLQHRRHSGCFSDISRFDQSQ